ncbi:MAG: ABC transporter permease [Acidimicrobiales bacterium]
MNRQAVATKLVRWSVVTAVVAFLAGPALIVAVASFNEGRYLDFPVEDYSLRWYANLLTDPLWRDATTSSLVVAGSSAGLAVVIALPLAYSLHTYRPRFARVLLGFGLLPFMLPPVISAISMLVFWGELGRPGRIDNVIVAHAVFFSSVPLLTITLALRSIDPAAGQAAATLGATPATVFRTITLPLLRPGIATGFVITLVLSLNEYIISFVVAQAAFETLPIRVFNSLRYGFTPTVAAMAVVFTLISVAVLAGLARFTGLANLTGPDRTDVTDPTDREDRADREAQPAV